MTEVEIDQSQHYWNVGSSALLVQNLNLPNIWGGLRLQVEGHRPVLLEEGKRKAESKNNLDTKYQIYPTP